MRAERLFAARTLNLHLVLTIMLITVLSTAALILGLASTVPHIVTMLRNRSSTGQSPVAWGLGVTVNAMMGYVNGVGFGAELLVAGNLVAGALCLAALACVMVLPKRETASSPSLAAGLVDMPTAEFVALKETVLQMEERRQARRRQTPPAA